MSRGALYNENEPYAAEWTQRLIAAGLVAPGVVDERSIRDVLAADLNGVQQGHFFAGIAVWSYALRLSGWPDGAPVWTGSCPCQPFSSAGSRTGFDDERHLWPVWFELIRQQRPPILFGEQVASPDGLLWFDSVLADLEGEGYAVGAADLCAAGVGSPNIRQRLYFVAIADGGRWRPDWLGDWVANAHVGGRQGARLPAERGIGKNQPDVAGRGEVDQLADPEEHRREGRADAGGSQEGGAAEQRPEHGGAGRLGDADGERRQRRQSEPGDDGSQFPSAQRAGGATGALADDPSRRRRQGSAPEGGAQRQDGSRSADAGGLGHASGDGDRQHARKLSGDEEEYEVGVEDGDHAPLAAGSVGAAGGGLADAPGIRFRRRQGAPQGIVDHGTDARRLQGVGRAVGAGQDRSFWGDAEWLLCSDGKARPVKSSIFPLAHGTPSRVGRLRAYGNAINPYVARAFIQAVIEVMKEGLPLSTESMMGALKQVDLFGGL